MKAIIQRVTEGRVTIAGESVAHIQTGLVALIGVGPADDAQTADKLLKRLLALRIFADEQDKMNLSVRDIQGGVLLVPNFTLMADTRKGNRPSFVPAAPPEQAKQLFEYLCSQAQSQHADVACGVFGADMQVSLCNNGPITISLEV